MAEHTPGPWRSDSPYVSAPSGEHRKIVADCDQYFSDDECEYLSDDECLANVRLIAAAPELLAALRVVMEHVDDLHGVDRGALAHPSWHWFKAARAAIATARGESDPKSEDEERTA